MRLAHRIAIYVPQADSYYPGTVTVQHDWRSVVADVRRALALKYGGASSYEVTGSWVMADGSLVTEPVTVVYAFSSDPADESWARELAATIRNRLRQEAVAVELDNAMNVWED